ncbi:hypothetical protein ACFCZ1_12655 [Streptomyces sp. NPDC056224]|uniref:hypothetical protein n=1 Tax=Streptomyces sp. NPDC056224 TaxID=3345750 RepID=UPI0035DA9A66
MDMNEMRAVELVYRLTKADLAEALRARDRLTASGRRRLWVLRGLGSLMLVLGVSATAGRASFIGEPFALVAFGVLLWAVSLFGHHLRARAFAGLLQRAGETRTVIDGSGLQVTTRASSTRMGWTAQPAYTETTGSFVTLGEARGAVSLTVLPKRGAQDPADIDRVRAMLDRNLKRL